MRQLRGLLSLSPLLVFLLVYLGSSILAGDFYRVPVSSAFLIACIFAVLISKGTLEERLTAFSRGAGHPDLLLMIWIFILAGAFTGIARSIGAVDATVALAIKVIPPRMLYAGLFLTACFISMAIGTSVGTIVALVPIGAGIAAQCDSSLAYMTAVIVGGALFGDNLSFISDTTIASTRAAGCEMKDKFKTNIIIILPAVLIVTAIYLIQGRSLQAVAAQQTLHLVRILPYVLIIVLSLCGCNVTLSLAIGILSCFIIGVAGSSLSWIGTLEALGGGVAAMNDLIVVTLLAGGLLEIIRREGGLDYIISHLSSLARGPRAAQASIASLVCVANLCTANNTIAIITTGSIARSISEKFGVDPKKTASILDTFSCMVQGFIPYGAQLLMASGLAGVASTAIIPYLYYPAVMGVCAILAILFDYPHIK